MQRRELRKTAALSLVIGAILVGGLTCKTSLSSSSRGKPIYPETVLVKHGSLEVVQTLQGPIATGVTVSHEGRIFLNRPRWAEPVTATVIELQGGQEVPYPTLEINQPTNPEHLFSVQSVVVDPVNRLWAVDTGSRDMLPIQGPEWPKLVQMDLDRNAVARVVHFPADVVFADSYLNDVRFDLLRGPAGTAYITDSSMNPEHAGIVVVDLQSGQSWRRLTGHDSVRGERTFVAMLDGKPVLLHRKGERPKAATIGVDGIALSPGGSRVFYCPLSSRRLYSVSAEALTNRQLGDADVARTVQEEKRDFASDGLESDAEGRLYLTDWEHNAIEVRTAAGQFETLVSDPRMVWPDTLSLAHDGYLYFTANQANRTPTFNGGEDRRQMPTYLFRIRVDGKPIRLAR